jgi:hypothetical protein
VSNQPNVKQSFFPTTKQGKLMLKRVDLKNDMQTTLFKISKTIMIHGIQPDLVVKLYNFAKAHWTHTSSHHPFTKISWLKRHMGE